MLDYLKKKPLCSLLFEAQGSLAEGSSMLWWSHLTVVKRNQKQQSATNLQVSFAILHALVSPCTLPELVFLMVVGKNKSIHKPEDLSMKISLVAKPDGATIWDILTEWSVNTTFCDVSLEVNPAVMSQLVTNLNLTPFCNSMKEVTECGYNSHQIFKTSKASTTTKQHINTVFIKIYAQEVHFFPQVSQSLIVTSDTCNCWKEQTRRSTAQSRNTKKCLPRKADNSFPCMYVQTTHSTD